MGNKKVVCVVLEVEGKGKPEYFKSHLISDLGYYLTEIDGHAVVSTLIPSNNYHGYYELLNELFSLELNEVTRELITNKDVSAAQLLTLLERFQVFA
jgi:hypothetical protein